MFFLSLKEKIDFAGDEHTYYMHREAQIKWFILLFSSSLLLLSYAMQFHSSRSVDELLIFHSPLRLFSSCNHKKEFACFLFAVLSLRHRMSYSNKKMCLNSLERWRKNEKCNSPEPQKNGKRAVCWHQTIKA